MARAFSWGTCTFFVSLMLTAALPLLMRRMVSEIDVE
jgi:hypothetical protein